MLVTAEVNILQFGPGPDKIWVQSHRAHVTVLVPFQLGSLDDLVLCLLIFWVVLVALFVCVFCFLIFQSGPLSLSNINPILRDRLTSVVGQLAAVDLVLHHVSPVQGALVEVEVQGNGVPQAGNQHAELALVQVDPSDLVAVGEDDEGLEGI